jgi:exopolysaccharide biosynthesis predicted pyruvyltransferase EpsI
LSAAAPPAGIEGLRDEVDRVVAGLLEAGEEVALVNYPNVDNPGDSAIWLGTRAALARRGVKLVFECEPRAYRRRLLARAAGERPTILLQGGGNLGDLYWRSGQQQVRMKVLRDFPRARVIQLPQTLWFERERRARRFAGLCASHDDLTVLLRDDASLERAASLGLEAVPCPDMAFGLGPLPRPAQPSTPVVWVARQERERRFELPELADGVEARDWPTAREQRRGDAGGRLRVELAALRRLTGAMGRNPALDRALLALGRRRYEPLARRRMALATGILARGRVVISDRFHGHVLASLMGIPNVLLDNSYGKNSAVYSTWSREIACAELAADPASAQQRALELAAAASMSP